MGGVRALRALGYNPSVWHMNEGHAAFLTLERARELVQAGRDFGQAMDLTRARNVFTTHTPVPAGNDEFPLWLVEKHLAALWPELKLEREQFFDLGRRRWPEGETFSMGVLALRNSERRNAVSELHGRVARRMWNFLWPDCPEDEVPITHVTNGVHAANWMARRLRILLDAYLGADWYDRLDERELWSAMDAIPDNTLWDIRLHLKRKLAFYMRERVRERWTHGGYHPVQVVSAGVLINPYALTIGFARRFATYKRAELDSVGHATGCWKSSIIPTGRFRSSLPARRIRPTKPARAILQNVYRVVKRAEASGRLVFLEDYDINLARYLVQGVDVWLNTPRRPLEASGTSGMKAAFNGVLNFSVLDGWWREAFNGANGWAIGADAEPLDADEGDRQDAEDLYRVLEQEIIPQYYERDPKEISPRLAGTHEGVHEDHHSALQHPPNGQGIRRPPVRSGVRIGMFCIPWLTFGLVGRAADLRPANHGHVAGHPARALCGEGQAQDCLGARLLPVSGLCARDHSGVVESAEPVDDSGLRGRLRHRERPRHGD